MRRRRFLALAAALWQAGLAAWAEGKLPRIGYLSPGSSHLTPRDKAFLQGLRERGYVDGKTIVIEYRFAEGHYERLAVLAGELVKLDVDVIVAVVTQASLAARSATSRIPFVMVAISDPVSAGLVTSLARPGANVTGTSSMSADVVGKSLEVLKEVMPKISRVAVLWNPANGTFQAQMLRQARQAADILGLDLEAFSIRDTGEFTSTFTTLEVDRIGGLLVLADPLFIVQKALLMALVEKSRLRYCTTQLLGPREEFGAPTGG